MFTWVDAAQGSASAANVILEQYKQPMHTGVCVGMCVGCVFGVHCLGAGCVFGV